LEPPPLVQRALALAVELGFEGSCTDETGALLHVLAGGGGRRRAGEIGTGTGVGAAWIVSALEPSARFVSVELDPDRAAAAASLFEHDPNVSVLTGDWRDLLPPEAPFDLLFVDGADAKDDVEAVLGLLAPRGVAVLDDFTPGRTGSDPRRRAWLGHPELAAVELLTTLSTAAIVAVRRI
jgi:predicted O-methyltransferase YrrM